MAWKKPDLAHVERFSRALPAHAEIQPKKMFGYPACFVNGNFFAGLHEDNVVLRLPGDIKPKFAELTQAAGFDPMQTGKGMKDWWIVPAAIASDAAALARLLSITFEEVRKLPPKAAKPARKRTATAGKRSAKKSAARR